MVEKDVWEFGYRVDEVSDVFMFVYMYHSYDFGCLSIHENVALKTEVVKIEKFVCRLVIQHFCKRFKLLNIMSPSF